MSELAIFERLLIERLTNVKTQLKLHPSLFPSSPFFSRNINDKPKVKEQTFAGMQDLIWHRSDHRHHHHHHHHRHYHYHYHDCRSRLNENNLSNTLGFTLFGLGTQTHTVTLKVVCFLKGVLKEMTIIKYKMITYIIVIEIAIVLLLVIQSRSSSSSLSSSLPSS
uniref:Uncharacterized protein n=1 Tax=Glossina palpalis gambiensis TaxID=67801 RepID=A0A1B0AMK8_9MUSC